MSNVECFTVTVVRGLSVRKRSTDGRLCCGQCGVAMDTGGGCGSCKAVKREWRAARIQHYADTRSLLGLAQMIVELEDSQDLTPEFCIDEEWPRG